jgi:phosphoadenosine phosphosulfate reductase
MLIKSDKITKKDYDLWSEYEEIDSKHKIQQWKISECKNAIDTFIRNTKSVYKENVYCMSSWGKDSVVVSHFCALAGITIIHIKTKRTHPLCDTVQDEFCKKVKCEIIVINESKYGNNWKHWGDGIKIASKKYPGKTITGLRGDESGIRSLSKRIYGTSCNNFCRPIISWTADDVFSYLHQHDLPIHPNYAMVGGGRWERGRIRVSSLLGERGNGIGRKEWEEEYYSDEIRRIIKNGKI